MATQAETDAFLRWHNSLSQADKDRFARTVAWNSGQGDPYADPAWSGGEQSKPGSRTKTVGSPVGIRVPEQPLPEGTQQIGGTLVAPVENPPPNGGGNGGGGGNAPDPEEEAAEARRQQQAIDYLRSNFGWVEQLGGLEEMVDMVRRGLTPDGIVAEVRNKQWYKDRFVSIRRGDGTMRMNEKEYMDTEEDYRKVLRRFGKYDPNNDKPLTYQGFFEAEVDANELTQRFEIYDQIDRGADDIKSTFYVYAGMRLTTDDLYEATVDPTKSRSLEEEYDRRVASQPIDYDTWITRATEAGLERTTKALERLKQQGAVGDIALQTLRGIDPVMARDLADQLYRSPGAADATGRFLSLSELQNAFTYALLGSAATANGLKLPGTDRLESLRQAGVNRARALEAYGQISTEKNRWAGALSRAHLDTMDEADFEAALLLSQGKERDMLERAERFDESLRFRGGWAAFGQDQTSGLLQQLGLRSLRA